MKRSPVQQRQPFIISITSSFELRTSPSSMPTSPAHLNMSGGIERHELIICVCSCQAVTLIAYYKSNKSCPIKTTVFAINACIKLQRCTKLILDDGNFLAMLLLQYVVDEGCLP